MIRRQWDRETFSVEGLWYFAFWQRPKWCGGSWSSPNQASCIYTRCFSIWFDYLGCTAWGWLCPHSGGLQRRAPIFTPEPWLFGLARIPRMKKWVSIVFCTWNHVISWGLQWTLRPWMHRRHPRAYCTRAAGRSGHGCSLLQRSGGKTSSWWQRS
jgi:hypothetical protein